MRTCSPSRRRTGGSSLARLVVVGRGRSWNGGGDERGGAQSHIFCDDGGHFHSLSLLKQTL